MPISRSKDKWPISLEGVPVSLAWNDWEFFYFPVPLDGMLVHRTVTPSSKFAGTHLYQAGSGAHYLGSWLSRVRHCGINEVSCSRTQRSALVRARIPSARSGVEHPNHWAPTPPPTKFTYQLSLGRYALPCRNSLPVSNWLLGASGLFVWNWDLVRARSFFLLRVRPNLR